MEYLVTYGWALMALLFVVAFLISSGAFSPSNFSTQECTFQPDLPCLPFIIYKLDSTHTIVSFNLSNGLGFPINITNATYTTDIGTGARHEMPSTSFKSGKIGPGESIWFNQTFEGASQPSANDFKTIFVAITYQNCKPGTCINNYTTSGRISTVVVGGVSTPAPATPDTSPPTITDSVVVNGGVYTITASATDASGISQIQMFVAQGSSESGHGPYTPITPCSSSPCTYTTGSSAGNYIYYVTATDNASPNKNTATGAVTAFTLT
jgi:hypothetical protein